MTKCEVRTLTRDDLIEWYGDDARYPTFKGKALIVDGELVGIGGLQYSQGLVIAFTDLKSREWKTAIHRTAVRLIRDAQQRHNRILAVQDKEIKGSDRWLARLGFKEISKGLWQWRQ